MSKESQHCKGLLKERSFNSWKLGPVLSQEVENIPKAECTACALLAADAIYHGLWEKAQMPKSSLGRSNVSRQCYMNEIREGEGG